MNNIIIPTEMLITWARQSVALIKERTLNGLDINDEPFKPYSTRPFKLPSGAVTKRARKLLLKEKKIQYFKRNGRLWMVVFGGYAALKKAIYKQTNYGGGVNLTLTFSMLRNLQIINIKRNEFIIGFKSREASQKAEWNIAKGRQFFGLSPKDVEFLSK